MEINQIRQGGIVTLNVIRGLQTIQFESKVAFGNEQGLFIEPIRHEEQLVNFDVSDFVMIDAIIVDINDIPYKWKCIEVKTAEFNKEKYHLLISKDDVGSMNRRKGYRLYLGVRGVVQFGANRVAYDVTVKDISECGVGFLCDKDIHISESTIISIQFVDEKTNAKFRLRAMAVRKMEIDDRMLYGCKLLAQSEEIRKFIMQRQREKIQKNALRQQRGVKN